MVKRGIVPREHGDTIPSRFLLEELSTSKTLPRPECYFPDGLSFETICLISSAKCDH
jgi:hypothetical protein